MPPVRNQEEPSEANIVSQLGKVFNIDEVYNAESSFIGSLKSVSDFHPVEVPPSCPLNFDEDIVEVCDPCWYHINSFCYSDFLWGIDAA